MKRSLAALGLATALFGLSPAHAALVEADWQSGDQRAVLDTNTGLKWLDLAVTDNVQYSTVVGLLNSTLSGWRLPTISEVQTMFANFFPTLGGTGTGAGSYNSATPVYTAAQAWENLFSTGASYKTGYGMFDVGGVVHLAGVSFQGSYVVIEPNWTPDFDYGSMPFYQMGTFLVQSNTITPPVDPDPTPSDVNAPLTVFAGLSLLGLAGFRRKVK